MLENFKQKPLKFHILLVLGLCLLLYIAFFFSLSFITRHKNEKRIPNVIGKDMQAALGELKGMGFDVAVDSTYDPEKKPYVVMGQIPDSGSMVKDGRMLFITVNKSTPPNIPMPNLVSLSYRSAEMILKSNKLALGDTTFKPDIAKGAVLEQIYKGKKIKPGDMIPQGSSISLVLGDGLGNTQFNVPDVIGQPYVEAMANLNGRGLQVIAVWDGNITDSSMAVIYDQQPKALNELKNYNKIREGENIDIRIKQNPTNEELERNRNAGTSVNSNSQNPQ
ncbi:MAG: PASTA domain-containing protein [Bacteroidota bacterium]